MFLPVEVLNFNLKSSKKLATKDRNNLYARIDDFGEELEFVIMGVMFFS
jgi:ribonuclease HII